ncbi:MAG TPA: peptide ABC transporter substrate-binding protein [Candidatus Eremiobacteraceae bacterium]
MTLRAAASCVAIVLLLSSSACTKISSTTAPPAAGTGVLRIVGAGSMDSLVPELSSIQSAVDLGMLWGAWLYLVNDRGDLEPELATEIPTPANGGISRDGRTITYHLRTGVKWHDGAPFEARDVIFTWHAIMSGDNNIISRSGWDDIASMVAPDPHTVVVHLVHPYAPAIAEYFGPGPTPMSILPAHLLANLHDINHAAYNIMPVGTGPFIVKSFDPSSGVVLTANPNYWRGPPRLREIDYLIVPDANTRAVMMKTGEADLFYDPPSSLRQDLSTIPGVHVLNTTFAEYWYLEFNTQHAPLDDVRVRRAISMGVDRDYVVRTVMRGAAIPAEGDQLPGTWAFDPNVHTAKYDPKGAAALLSAAGWLLGPDGVRHKDGKALALVFAYSSGRGDSVRLAPVFQNMMKQIGIAIELKSYPTSLLEAAKQAGGILKNGNFDVAHDGWIGGVDPDDDTLFACDQIPPAGYNTTFYCDPRIDAQLHIGMTNFDRSVRAAAYSRIDALLAQDAPLDFLYWTKRLDAVRDTLHGYRPAPAVTEFWNSWEWSI